MTTERQEPLNESVVDPATVSIDSPTEDVTTFEEPQTEVTEDPIGVGVDDGDIQVGE